MSTDVRLDQVDGSFLELDARVVKAISSDFMLDQPSRRKGGGPHRRALVHDQNEGLTINFSGDYPGGVTLVDIKTLQVRGDITFGMPGIKATEPGTVMVSAGGRQVRTNASEGVRSGRGIEIGSKEWKEFRKELAAGVHTKQIQSQV